MRFHEPRWAILFPESYHATRKQLIKDWSVVAGGLVAALVACAWISQPGLF